MDFADFRSGLNEPPEIALPASERGKKKNKSKIKKKRSASTRALEQRLLPLPLPVKLRGRETCFYVAEEALGIGVAGVTCEDALQDAFGFFGLPGSHENGGDADPRLEPIGPIFQRGVVLHEGLAGLVIEGEPVAETQVQVGIPRH